MSRGMGWMATIWKAAMGVATRRTDSVTWSPGPSRVNLGSADSDWSRTLQVCLRFSKSIFRVLVRELFEGFAVW